MEEKKEELRELVDKLRKISREEKEKSGVEKKSGTEKKSNTKENGISEKNKVCHKNKNCKSESRIILNNRDRDIIFEISRLKCVLGRQIKVIAGFSGKRACDRRLSKLIGAEYLERKRYLYGISGIYSITQKAKKQFNISLPISEIRLDQIEHDVAVTDTIIYFMKDKDISKANIITEKQLRNEQGFTIRTHLPDFVYKEDGKTYCIEVELSLKAKERFEKIIKQNFMTYDIQYWIVPNSKIKIREILKNNSSKYTNIELLELESIQDYINALSSEN